jgi:hypothetical protein
MIVDRDRWTEVQDKLAAMTVDAAVRAKVAADLREEIDEAAGEMSGVVQMHMYDLMRLFVAEWQSAERLLEVLGMSPYPLDEFVITEDERKALDDLRALLPRILEAPAAPKVDRGTPPAAVPDPTPAGAAGDAPGGVREDLLGALRSDPCRWWTVRELVAKTGRAESSIYGRGGMRVLVDRGEVAERRDPVRQFQIRDPQGEAR